MTHLKEGDPAPKIEGLDQDGKEVSLDQYKGKKVILYFYPRDNTPTCTDEACNFRDNHTMLLEKGFEVIGVSDDSQRKHKNFINKFNLPFRLLSDPEHKTIERYGVWGPKKFMGRKFDGTHRETFVINENGKIETVITAVKSKNHTEQILEALDN